MVDSRPLQDLGHESTIYVLSQLPHAQTAEVFQSLASTSSSTQDLSIIPWHIQNRYYATEVQFNIFESPEELHEELKRVNRDITPALMVIVDNSKTVEDDILDQFDTDLIDVPLVVGKSTSTANTGLPWEEMMQQCISKGWEYVDLSDNGEDELGGQSGISRLSEALQAHIWPMDPRSSAPRTARISQQDSDDEDDNDEDNKDTDAREATTSSTRHRARRDSNTSSSDGFDDNFSPFISAASRDATLSAALSSPSLDDTSVPTFPSSAASEDYQPFDDAGEEDPTAHLADMFASFAGLRERALNMQDRTQKMDFAEEIAMRFAKQLDLLMGEELDEIPDVPLPDIGTLSIGSVEKSDGGMNEKKELEEGAGSTSEGKISESQTATQGTAPV